MPCGLLRLLCGMLCEGLASAAGASRHFQPHIWLRRFVPRRPIEVVMFSSEEPTRFGLSCSGSRAMAGGPAASHFYMFQTLWFNLA